MTEPALLSYRDVGRARWGGGAEGRTLDHVYVVDDDVCQIVFEIPVRGYFGQAGDGFDAYQRDTVWRVLAGVLVALNAETGEVSRVTRGESLAFGGDVWLQGWNYGDEPVRVAEFTAPAKSQAVSVRRKAWPSQPVYARAELEARSSQAHPDTERAATVKVLRRDDLLWRLEGSSSPILVGHIHSTPAITVGEIELLPGATSDPFHVSSITTMLVIGGALAVELMDEDRWLEAGEGDGIYLPGDTRYRLIGRSRGRTEVLFQTVPARERPTENARRRGTDTEDQ